MLHDKPVGDELCTVSRELVAGSRDLIRHSRERIAQTRAIIAHSETMIRDINRQLEVSAALLLCARSLLDQGQRTQEPGSRAVRLLAPAP